MLRAYHRSDATKTNETRIITQKSLFYTHIHTHTPVWGPPPPAASQIDIAVGFCHITVSDMAYLMPSATSKAKTGGGEGH